MHRTPQPYLREGPTLGRYLGLLPADGEGAEILLQQVPEKKRDKNRVHLELRTSDLSPTATSSASSSHQSPTGDRRVIAPRCARPSR